jgi:hypothetical protein
MREKVYMEPLCCIYFSLSYFGCALEAIHGLSMTSNPLCSLVVQGYRLLSRKEYLPQPVGELSRWYGKS